MDPSLQEDCRLAPVWACTYLKRGKEKLEKFQVTLFENFTTIRSLR
jgi:hypothetical protein